MKKKFLFDQEKCVGCYACVIGCKDEFKTSAQINYRLVRPGNENPATPERVYVNFACAHCDEPACLKSCPVNAYSKRPDGIVQHNVSRCIGCKLCTVSCPYGTPKYDKEVGKVYKCQFCYQRQDKDMLPTCVQSCPVGALGVIDIETSTVTTSLGTRKVENTVDHLAELPSNKITKPNHRFIVRQGGKQSRYDTAG